MSTEDDDLIPPFRDTLNEVLGPSPNKEALKQSILRILNDSGDIGQLAFDVDPDDKDRN